MVEPIFNYTHIKKQIIKCTQRIAESEQNLEDFSGFDYNYRERLKLDLELSKRKVTEFQINLERVFDPLLKNSGKDRETEANMLIAAIEKGNIAYSVRLKDWLNEMMPSKSDIILLCGGTAEYLDKDFQVFLQDKILEGDIGKLYLHLAIKIPKNITDANVSKERFADIYSLWHRINSRLNLDLEVA